MKDLYSFHLTEEDLDSFYEEAKAAYDAVYTRCGLKAIFTEASGGLFTKYSHEYQVEAAAGEDDIYLSEDGSRARNKEIVPDENDPELLTFGGGKLRKTSAIEVGNIFKLKRRYSTPMGATVSGEDGAPVDVWMGCYGIGISRLIGTAVEVHGELGEAGKGAKVVWPGELAPFAVHLLDLTADKAGEKLYNDLLSQGVDILYDDRLDKSAGEKFADADLIGAPVRLIISKRSLEAGGVERIEFATGKQEIVALGAVANSLTI